MRASAGGRLIGYEEAGSGTPLLLLHGFPFTRRMWAPQLAGLTGRARCIAPDLRGFGETPADPPFTMDQYAEDAIALLDALGIIEPVVVCGFSMGGYIALALWRRHPDRVRALILANTRANADGPEAVAGRHAIIGVARRDGPAAVAKQLAPKWLSPHTQRRSPETLGGLEAMAAAQSVEGIVGASEAMLHRPDSMDMLATITIPTLIVVGEDDAITPPDVAEAMHRAIPHSRLEQLRLAGHLSSVERPAAFNGVVAEFLARVGSAEQRV